MVRQTLITVRPFLCAAMALLAVAPWSAGAQILHEGWTREEAALLLETFDTRPAVNALTELTVAGAETDLLALLEATKLRPDWPAPARDAAIFLYARSLATWEAHAPAEGEEG